MLFAEVSFFLWNFLINKSGNFEVFCSVLDCFLATIYSFPVSFDWMRCILTGVMSFWRHPFDCPYFCSKLGWIPLKSFDPLKIIRNTVHFYWENKSRWSLQRQYFSDIDEALHMMRISVKLWISIQETMIDPGWKAFMNFVIDLKWDLISFFKTVFNIFCSGFSF